MSIATVLFDADGVVQRPTADRRAQWTRLLGGNEDAVDGFVRDAFDAERPCCQGKDDFLAAFPGVMTRWNCTGTMEDALRAWTAIEVDAGIVTLIATVRTAGVPCCLATNQERFRGRYMSETLGYRDVFDRQFYSCELGVSKPDPAYFTAILDTLAVPPASVLFIDDAEANVRAAESVGIVAELFSPDAGTEPVLAMRRLLARYGLAAGPAPGPRSS